MSHAGGAPIAPSASRLETLYPVFNYANWVISLQRESHAFRHLTAAYFTPLYARIVLVASRVLVFVGEIWRDGKGYAFVIPSSMHATGRAGS